MYQFVVAIPLRKYWDRFFDQGIIVDEYEGELDNFTVSNYRYGQTIYHKLLRQKSPDFVLARSKSIETSYEWTELTGRDQMAL